MDSLVESYEHAGLRVEIHYDTDTGDCPLEWGDDDVQFVTFERNSTLSEYHEFSSPENMTFPTAGTVFNLYKYEHSGVAYAIKPFSCPWDSGQVGAIFVSDEHTNPKEVATSVCDMVAAWCNGESYGYQIYKDDEELDSCWGFLGDIAYCTREANAAAKCEAKHLEKERITRLKTLIKHRVPLEYRQSHG